MIYAGDEDLAWNDAGPCPNCADPDCWLGCDPDSDDETRVVDVVCAEDVQCGDVLDGYVVYDVAASLLEPDHVVIAAARNGRSVAVVVERTDQVEVVR